MGLYSWLCGTKKTKENTAEEELLQYTHSATQVLSKKDVISASLQDDSYHRIVGYIDIGKTALMVLPGFAVLLAIKYAGIPLDASFYFRIISAATGFVGFGVHALERKVVPLHNDNSLELLTQVERCCTKKCTLQQSKYLLAEVPAGVVGFFATGLDHFAGVGLAGLTSVLGFRAWRVFENKRFNQKEVSLKTPLSSVLTKDSTADIDGEDYQVVVAHDVRESVDLASPSGTPSATPQGKVRKLDLASADPVDDVLYTALPEAKKGHGRVQSFSGMRGDQRSLAGSPAP